MYINFSLTSDDKYRYFIHMEATVVNTFSYELTRQTMQKDLEMSAQNPSESMWIGVDVDSIYVSDSGTMFSLLFKTLANLYSLVWICRPIQLKCLTLVKFVSKLRLAQINLKYVTNLIKKNIYTLIYFKGSEVMFHIFLNCIQKKHTVQHLKL